MHGANKAKNKQKPHGGNANSDESTRSNSGRKTSGVFEHIYNRLECCIAYC